MRRFLLLFIIALNFSTLSAHADDQVANQVATDTSQDVNIDLPPDLEPGFHTAVAEVTDPDTGEVTTQEIYFCKDSAGEIHWDNICPDVITVVDPTTLENVTNPQALPNYSPLTEPSKTSQAQIVGFTALSVISAGGAAAASAGFASGGGGAGGSSGGSGSGGGGTGNSSARETSRREERDTEGGDEKQEKLLHASHTKIAGLGGVGIASEISPGIGDKSFTWKSPLTNVFDSAFLVASLKVSRFSPLLSKIFLDASYLRAIFGSLSIFTMPLGIFLGYLSLSNTDSQPVPPSWKIASAMMVLGVFDSFAGLTAAAIFVGGVFVAGNVHNQTHLLTLMAYLAICVAPSIIAGSFRPLRRKVETGEHLWERGVDYLLGALLTGWTISKFIQTLNVVAGKQLPIVGHTSSIGIAIVISVILRMIFEDIGIYFYPIRIHNFSIAAASPSKTQQYISALLKVFIFAAVMKSFVGMNLQLLIGSALFVIPNLLKLGLGHILPKSRQLHFTLPKGAVRILVMTLLGSISAALAKHYFKNPQDFLTWGFVLLSVPGFLLSLLGLLSDEKNPQTLKNHKVGIWIYRLGGLVVFYLIIEIILGKDISAFLGRLVKF
jgi:hypothetical protein